MTSARVRSGWVAAKRAHIKLPSEIPKSAARSTSAASRTAVRSSIRCSRVAGPSVGSERPVPGLSKTISLEKEANRCMKRAIRGWPKAPSRWETKPGTMTRSIGPSPATE